MEDVAKRPADAVHQGDRGVQKGHAGFRRDQHHGLARAVHRGL
jgi:hypothetical protein